MSNNIGDRQSMTSTTVDCSRICDPIDPITHLVVPSLCTARNGCAMSCEIVPRSAGSLCRHRLMKSSAAKEAWGGRGKATVESTICNRQKTGFIFKESGVFDIVTLFG